MNLLFRIVYAAHANGTHHKLALDALRHLENTDATRWQRLFLSHSEVYLEGSKAPDKEFKDFKNHVLHVGDNFWGGAPEKVESWYQRLVDALKARGDHDFSSIEMFLHAFGRDRADASLRVNTVGPNSDLTTGETDGLVPQ